MPKRTDILETLQLTLELLKRIRKDRSITASELQQKLIDVDAKFTRELRTIQRLLETLSDPDFKACSIERDESSKPYRYRWPDEVRDEVLARLLALNAERAAEEKLIAGGAKAIYLPGAVIHHFVPRECYTTGWV